MNQRNSTTLATALAEFIIAKRQLDHAKTRTDMAFDTIMGLMLPTMQFTNENGWLTDVGQAVLKSMWLNEIPATEAGEFLGISGSGAWRWYNRWNKEWNEANAA